MVNKIRKELTSRQERILRAVEAFILERGYPPTVRRLGRLLGIASPSAVFKHLTSLEKKGYLRRDRGELQVAGITSGPAVQFVSQGSLEGRQGRRGFPAGPLEGNPFKGFPSKSYRVPLAGIVPAGSPKEAFETSGETMDIPDWMLGRKRGNIFCIRVEGKSMIDAYIDDGDNVLLERTNTASSGEMIVGLLDDGSVTLKRLRREDGRTILVPENPAYQPFEVENLRVLGRVIGVLRKY